MIYDVHTHIGLDQAFYLRKWWPYSATAQDLLEAMAANGVDKAVCFPFGTPSAFDTLGFADRHRMELLPGRIPFDRENDLLAMEIGRLDTDRRLLMLAMFDPNRCIAGQLQNLERLRPHFVGLKVQATILESPITGLLGQGRPLMEFAEAHRLPVLIHTSIIPADQWSQASDCLRIAEAFPKARFNLAHNLRFHKPSLQRAAQLPNVWVDCGAHLAHCQLAADDHPAVAVKAERLDADYSRPAEVLQAMHACLGKGKFLWGSDNPFMSWCDDTIKAVYSYDKEARALHALPPAVKADIAHHAPESWLGIR